MLTSVFLGHAVLYVITDLLVVTLVNKEAISCVSHGKHGHIVPFNSHNVHKLYH